MRKAGGIIRGSVAVATAGEFRVPANRRSRLITAGVARSPNRAMLRAVGTMSKEDYDGIERNACPTVGACGGMYTANTMSSSFEALGMSCLLYTSPSPRDISGSRMPSCA